MGKYYFDKIRSPTLFKINVVLPRFIEVVETEYDNFDLFDVFDSVGGI